MAAQPARARRRSADCRSCCRTACAVGSACHIESKAPAPPRPARDSGSGSAGSRIPAVRRTTRGWRCRARARSAAWEAPAVSHRAPARRGADHSLGSRDCPTGSRGRSSCIASSERMEPRSRSARQGWSERIPGVTPPTLLALSMPPASRTPKPPRVPARSPSCAGRLFFRDAVRVASPAIRGPERARERRFR